jgi:hypothetical protein
MELDPEGQSTEPDAPEPDTGQSVEPETGQSVEPETGQSVEPEPEEGQSVEPETGQSVEPETGQSVEPEPETGQSVEPEPEEGQSTEPEPEEGQSTEPEPEDGQSVEPEPDDDDDDEDDEEDQSSDDGQSAVESTPNPDGERTGPPTQEEVEAREALDRALGRTRKGDGRTDPSDDEDEAGAAGVVGASAAGIAGPAEPTKNELLGNPVGVEPHTGGPIGEIRGERPGFDGSSGSGDLDIDTGPEGARAKPDGPENVQFGSAPLKPAEEEPEDDDATGTGLKSQSIFLPQVEAETSPLDDASRFDDD